MMKPMRLFYEKTGTAKYISHLDINRCMQRAMKRAGIPLWFTEGFNPHAYLTFPLPLALGYESVYECVDFRLIEEMSEEELVSRLNEVFPMGLRAVSAAEPQMKSLAIVSASYEARLQLADTEAEKAKAILEAFFAQPEIKALKRTKKGEKEISLKEHLHELSLSVEGGEVLMRVTLPAGNDFNINPTLVLDAFAKDTGMMLDSVKVLKTGVYAEKGEKFC